MATPRSCSATLSCTATTRCASSTRPRTRELALEESGLAVAQGETWAAGQLLPMGWTETQLAELKNGSLLLTSRTGYGYIAAGLRRAFARSDDGGCPTPQQRHGMLQTWSWGLAGGETWAQTWLLEDRQQDVYAGSCDQTLVSDPESGMVYYSLPSATNLSRSNYVSAPPLEAGLINADSALPRRPSSNHPTAGPIGSWRKSSTAPAPATPTPG